MKKTALLFLPLLFLSCGSKTENASLSEKEASVSEPISAVATYDLHKDRINCTINAEQPGDTPWSLAVGEWLDECLGGCYDGDPRDMKALVDFYGKAKADTLRAAQDDPNPYVEMEFDATMEKAYETEQFVTYTLSTCIGLGGAHPLSTEEGATFRKSDGRRLDWSIVRRTMDMELNELIKTSLMDYVGAEDEEQMEQFMPDADIYALPLPKTPPYLLENGVAFIYQQYEIMGYAMGMPTDTIGYERMKPLLTQTAQKLLP